MTHRTTHQVVKQLVYRNQCRRIWQHMRAHSAKWWVAAGAAPAAGQVGRQALGAVLPSPVSSRSSPVHPLPADTWERFEEEASPQSALDAADEAPFSAPGASAEGASRKRTPQPIDPVDDAAFFRRLRRGRPLAAVTAAMAKR